MGANVPLERATPQPGAANAAHSTPGAIQSLPGDAMLSLIHVRTEVHYDQALALLESYRDAVAEASDELRVCA